MPDTEGPQSRARVIRERTIQAEVRARIHQGMDHEECAAVAAATRDEFADVPLPTPMSRLQVAIRKAGGWLTTDGWRERESFAMATEEETNWFCLGRGFVNGPLFRGRCPNPHCPYRPATKGPNDRS